MPSLSWADGRRGRVLHVKGGTAFKSPHELYLIDWSPDEKSLLAIERRRPVTLRAYGAETGAATRCDILFDGYCLGPVGTRAFLSESHQVPSKYSRAIVVWDLDRSTHVAVLPTAGRGDLVASSDDAGVVVLQAGRRVSIHTTRSDAPALVVPGRAPVAVSPDGSRILYRSSKKPSLHVLRSDGRKDRSFATPESQTVNAAAFSANGLFVFGGLSDGSVMCWDVEARRLAWRLAVHERPVVAVASSPDGATFYSLGADHRICAVSADGALRWCTTLRRATTLGRPRREPVARVVSPDWMGVSDGSVAEGPGRIVPSPSGASLAVELPGGTLRVLDASTGRERCAHDGHDGCVTCLVVSANGRMVASGGADGDVRVYDVSTGETLWVLEVDPDEVTSVEFLPDRPALRTCGRDGVARRWSLATGLEEGRWSVAPGAANPYSNIGTVHGVFYTRASRDGSRVLVRRGARLELWSDRTSERVLWSCDFEADTAFHEAFTSDDRIIVCTKDRGYRLESMDAATGQRLDEVRPLHDRFLLTLQETDDGPVSVSASVRPDEIFVTEERPGGRERRFRVANASIKHAALSSDGRWLALATAHGVDVWCLDGACSRVGFASFRREDDAPMAVALSPDGALLVIGTALGRVVFVANGVE